MGWMRRLLTKLKALCWLKREGGVSGRWPPFAVALGENRPNPHFEFHDNGNLCVDHFNTKKVMFWAPEMTWPLLYPDGRPKCPIHGCTSCVKHRGWRATPRRAVDIDAMAFIWGRAYECKETNQCFSSYSAAVLALAPKTVLNYWKEHGYHVTHKSAIRYTMVDEIRNIIATGGSVGG